jgi:hypothetical protein
MTGRGVGTKTSATLHQHLGRWRRFALRGFRLGPAFGRAGSLLGGRKNAIRTRLCLTLHLQLRHLVHPPTRVREPMLGPA